MNRVLENRKTGRVTDYSILHEHDKQLYAAAREAMDQIHSELGHWLCGTWVIEAMRSSQYTVVVPEFVCKILYILQVVKVPKNIVNSTLYKILYKQ